jgi:hypothetical protein
MSKYKKTKRCKKRTEVKEGSYRYANNPTNKKSRRDFKLETGVVEYQWTDNYLR